MRNQIIKALLLCLTAGCVLSFSGWRSAAKTAQASESRAATAERQAEALEQLLADISANETAALENDPISAFFDALPYSGATAGYLAFLEKEAYQSELAHAAALLRSSENSALIDGFLALLDAQALNEAEAWRISLEAQGAVTAGALAQTTQCQIPIYRFGVHALAGVYQQDGTAYPFLFSPEAVRQVLLDAGFREEELSPAETFN